MPDLTPIGVLGQGGKPPRPAVPTVLLILAFCLSFLGLLDNKEDDHSSGSETWSSGRGSRVDGSFVNLYILSDMNFDTLVRKGA